MNAIANRLQVLSQFNRSIKLDLVRFGTKSFGHICHQTGKKMFFTNSTRLGAAVLIASRYGSHQSYADGAHVNPQCVAHIHGLDMAIDFLIGTGFCRVEKINGQKTLVAIEKFNMEKNQ